MYKHARNLEFEEAARLRDEIAGGCSASWAFGAAGCDAG